MDNEYVTINLKDIIPHIDEELLYSYLNSFTSKNKDVEMYIRQKAVQFCKSNISTTFLVFRKINSENVLVGYFALASKNMNIRKNHCLSKTLVKRIKKFAILDRKSGDFDVTSILIGQLGKNFSVSKENSITGSELLHLACEKVREIQHLLSGKCVFLECQDLESLKKFYSENGFFCFGKRELDKDEVGGNSEDRYLLQWLKYLD